MMENKISIIILLFLSMSLFACGRERIKIEDMRGENLMILSDVIIRDMENGEERMRIHSQDLRYDKSRSILNLGNGRIISQIRGNKIYEDLNITFKEATYNLVDGNVLLDKVGGILLDRNVRINTDKIHINVKSGDVSVENGVRVTGTNFDFIGDGFSGNIKNGVYSFENGIVARIF